MPWNLTSVLKENPFSDKDLGYDLFLLYVPKS